jgi:glycosyltransferase involved in cell wall biosynthesis
MKIAVMLRHYDQHEGGVKVYTHTIMPRLLRLGQEHEFLLLYKNRRRLGTFADFPNVKEMVCPLPTRSLWDQVGVPWIAHKEKVDVIFNTKFAIPLFSRAKKVFVLHGSEMFVLPEAFPWLDRLYVTNVMPVYCRKADAFIAVSSAVARDAVEHAHVDPNKIVTVHYGFEHHAFRVIKEERVCKDVRDRYNLPNQFVLWVGQIDPRKNVPRLLRAFARIKDQVPHHLVICGEKTPGGKHDTDEIDRLGIRDRVRFPGWVFHDDLPALYNLADLFVLPSLYEGFGIPLIEAMACGCPVITSKTASPPEVTKGAAILVDPLSVDDIAAGMLRVLLNPSLQKEMVEKGLRRAEEFSWDKCARSVLQVLEALAERQPAPSVNRSIENSSLWKIPRLSWRWVSCAVHTFVAWILDWL